MAVVLVAVGLSIGTIFIILRSENAFTKLKNITKGKEIKMKRVLTSILILTVVTSLALVVTGCPPKPAEEVIEEPTTTEEEVAPPVPEEEEEFTLVIRMMDSQDKWFKENIIPQFEEEYDVTIKVISFDKMWDIETMLKMERDSGNFTIGLVKTPLEMTRVLTAPERDFLQPFDDIMEADELTNLKEEYDSLAIKMGTIEGKLYYLPRKLETRMMIYLKPKVEEAVANWQNFEAEIVASLKEVNEYGLPAGYTLEADPNEWDYYDIFVVSYYWANTPYFGIEMPRMAHRGKRYGGTVQGLVDRAYNMDATQDDILKMNSDPVVDMFEWEAVYRKYNLYNEGMWVDPWSGGGIWNAMKDGKVFLAMMHQIDCFFIHGGTHPTMEGYLVDPDDLGEAVMPLGVSVGLDADGKPVRVGSKKASSGGWWWSIPKTAPYPELSVELAKWITNYDNHLAECKTFGMMPVRKDILDNLGEAFPEGWMGEVFATSISQLELNGENTVPLIAEYSNVGINYLDAWYDIVVDENYGEAEKVDRDYIKKVLDETYVPEQKSILGEGYPE